MPWRGQRGAILTEHLVAVSVLGIVVVAVFGMLAAGTLAAAIAQRQSQAAALAQHQLEEARAAGYQAALSRPRQAVDPARYPGYEWQLDVRVSGARIKQVESTVYWTARRERRVTFVTYLRDR
jgi:type II secretory pathway pseudopilin PulG